MSSAKFSPPSKKPLAIVHPSGTLPIKVGLFSEYKLDLQRKKNRNFPEPLPAGTCLHSSSQRTGSSEPERLLPKNASTEHDVYRPSEAATSPSVGSRFGKSRNVGKHRKPHSTAETCFALVRSRALVLPLSLSHSLQKTLNFPVIEACGGKFVYIFPTPSPTWLGNPSSR